MNKQPNEITVCNLEVVLMPQGEIICLGQTIGWFKKYKKYLSIKEEEKIMNFIKGYKIIDAEKLKDFLKEIIPNNKFDRNFIAYKIAENETKFLRRR